MRSRSAGSSAFPSLLCLLRCLPLCSLLCFLLRLLLCFLLHRPFCFLLCLHLCLLLCFPLRSLSSVSSSASSCFLLCPHLCLLLCLPLCSLLLREEKLIKTTKEVVQGETITTEKEKLDNPCCRKVLYHDKDQMSPKTIVCNETFTA